MEGFVAHVLPAVPDAQLALVGPETAAVSDDPEGAQVLEDCQEAWRAYPAAVRERVALVCLPMTDLEENAVIVNAIQRHSTVIVQKSLAEGFGLTVSEAMWKSRPVIASRVGGIVDQIVDGDSGVLVQDPADLREFGEAVVDDPSAPGGRDANGAVREGKGRRSLPRHAQPDAVRRGAGNAWARDDPARRGLAPPAPGESALRAGWRWLPRRPQGWRVSRAAWTSSLLPTTASNPRWVSVIPAPWCCRSIAATGAGGTRCGCCSVGYRVGSAPGPIDGRYGPRTEQGVARFQAGQVCWSTGSPARARWRR